MRIDTPDRAVLEVIDSRAHADCASCANHGARCRSSNAPEERDIMRFRSGSLVENWYVAALSKQVNEKRPYAATILEEPLVLFRRGDGGPVAVVDRCLHRNAALSKGAVFNGQIGCPYHGWTYDAQGDLVNIPSEGPETFPRPGRTLERFPVVEQDGLIWVYMGTPERAAE